MSLDALLAAWQNHKPGGQGPHERVLLWQNDSCLVAIDDAMGPMVPYPAVIHENGEMNHGYRSLKGDAAAIEQVPELKRFPEFAGFIGAINHADSPIESVGCENGFFDAEGQDVAKKMIGSYVDVVFSDVERNASPENFLHLAAWLLTPRRTVRSVVGHGRISASATARPWRHRRAVGLDDTNPESRS